ncbi:hypothetical protein CCS92_33645, partial [Methylobacterium radiotolerans]
MWVGGGGGGVGGGWGGWWCVFLVFFCGAARPELSNSQTLSPAAARYALPVGRADLGRAATGTAGRRAEAGLGQPAGGRLALPRLIVAPRRVVEARSPEAVIANLEA